VNGGEQDRIAQAKIIDNFTKRILCANPSAKIVALGDWNEFLPFPPLQVRLTRSVNVVLYWSVWYWPGHRLSLPLAAHAVARTNEPSWAAATSKCCRRLSARSSNVMAYMRLPLSCCLCRGCCVS
jgi:hypothetical protein